MACRGHSHCVGSTKAMTLVENKNPSAAAPGFLGQVEVFQEPPAACLTFGYLRGLFKSFAPASRSVALGTARRITHQVANHSGTTD
jgi:hypothetical protein